MCGKWHLICALKKRVQKMDFGLSKFFSSVECKWHLGQSRGTFASPYFPDNYHDYQDCQWNITVPKGRVIRLKFDVFELESTPFSCGGGQCSCDYVEVKEESTLGDRTVLGRYCMMATPPSIIESSTNRLIVTFHSDHAISAKGFNVSYTTIASITGNNLYLIIEISRRTYARTVPTGHVGGAWALSKWLCMHDAR